MTNEEKDALYAASGDSVTLINAINAEAPTFPSYESADFAATIVDINKQHLEQVVANPEMAGYDFTTFTAAISTADSFLVTYPAPAREVITPPPEAGTPEWYTQQEAIMVDVLAMMAAVEADAPAFNTFGDADFAAEVIFANKSHTEQLLAKADWSAVDTSSWSAAISSADTFLVTYPVPAPVQRPEEGSLEDYQNKYNALLDSETAINNVIADTTLSVADKIDILSANRDHIALQLADETYSTYSLDTSVMLSSYNTASAQVLSLSGALTEGVVENIFNSYLGDPSGNDDTSFLAAFTGTPDSQSVVTEVSSTTLPETTSKEIVGYFLASYTGDHTFYSNSDDFSYLWVGDNAIANYTVANADIDNGGLHAATELSTTVSLESGVYYPIRIQFGNNTGPGTMVFSYEHTGQTKTTDLTGKLFHNTDLTNSGF